jgi:hypothetical protein
MRANAQALEVYCAVEPDATSQLEGVALLLTLLRNPAATSVLHLLHIVQGPCGVATAAAPLSCAICIRETLH